jgi:DNA-binding NarL/FixJ family response regulator
MYLVNMFNSNGAFTHNRIINTKYGERYYVRYTFINQTQEISLPCFIIHLNNLAKPDDEAEVTLLRDYELSTREEIIAQYAGIGLTNKEIAEKLCISPFTVQNHLKNIFDKTGLKNRTQLANLVK